MNLAMYIGLVKKTICDAREAFFSGSSPTKFSANGSLLKHAHRHGHMPMRIHKGRVSPSFSIQPKTADGRKNGRFYHF